MDLITIGANYKTAPLDIREKLFFSADEILDILKNSKEERRFIKEFLILSTCNRTELYIVTPIGKRNETIDYALKLINQKKGVDLSATTATTDLSANKEIYYILNFEQSVKHVFEVASSLDSMVLGENQILGQMKEAYALSCKSGTSGIILSKLFHNSFRVGKRVRAETKLGTGAVSVSSVSVKLIREIFKDISDRSALLIGLGKMGELAAASLKKSGVKNLFVSNRTFSKAEDLAVKMKAEAVVFDEIDRIMNKVDIVISSAGSAESIIKHAQMEKIMRLRKNKPIFIMDIAVPRNFAPDVKKIRNVFLYSIDDLMAISGKNLSKRLAEVPKADAIIDCEIKKFMEWFGTLKISPLIHKLREKFEYIRNSEVEKNKNRFRKDDIKKIDALTKTLVNKILHLPITKMKEFNENSEMDLMRFDIIREIFEVDKADEKNEN